MEALRVSHSRMKKCKFWSGSMIGKAWVCVESIERLGVQAFLVTVKKVENTFSAVKMLKKMWCNLPTTIERIKGTVRTTGVYNRDEISIIFLRKLCMRNYLIHEWCTAMQGRRGSLQRVSSRCLSPSSSASVFCIFINSPSLNAPHDFPVSVCSFLCSSRIYYVSLPHASLI